MTAPLKPVAICALLVASLALAVVSSHGQKPTQSHPLSAFNDPLGSPRQGQSIPDNPHYPPPNPFYFEGRIDYELLQIDEPGTPWEFMQRGIHRQDDLEDLEGAIADYREALGEPSLFTARLRLGVLLLHEDPEEATRLFKEVLAIDPQKLEVNFLIGEAYKEQKKYEEALDAFRAELALSPITETTIRLTGDEANNAHTHYEMGEIFQELGRFEEATEAYQNYLKATRWHSDVYPWRIPLVQKKIEQLSGKLSKGSGWKIRRERRQKE